MTTFKSDGSEWYNYFQIRKNDEGHYYFAWIGSKRRVFTGEGEIWRSPENMKRWIVTQDWKSLVDEEFEKEVLGGS